MNAKTPKLFKIIKVERVANAADVLTLLLDPLLDSLLELLSPPVSNINGKPIAKT